MLCHGAIFYFLIIKAELRAQLQPKMKCFYALGWGKINVSASHPQILKLHLHQYYLLSHFLHFVRFRFPSVNSGRFINSDSNWYQTLCNGQLLANIRTWSHLLGVCRSSCISHPCKYIPISRLIAQLVDRCTGIAAIVGSNSSLNRALFSQLVLFKLCQEVIGSWLCTKQRWLSCLDYFSLLSRSTLFCLFSCCVA